MGLFGPPQDDSSGSLKPKGKSVSSPLADRMRPETIEEFVGQTHILGPGKPLRKQIERDELASIILWGPPGSGKTTLATIIAQENPQRVRPLQRGPFRNQGNQGSHGHGGKGAAVRAENGPFH